MIRFKKLGMSISYQRIIYIYIWIDTSCKMLIKVSLDCVACNMTIQNQGLFYLEWFLKQDQAN